VSLPWARSIQSYFLKILLILSSQLHLGIPSDLFFSDFPIKTLYVLPFFPASATCPAHLDIYIQGYSKWLSEFQQLVIHNTLEIAVYVLFYLIEKHSKFLLHTLHVLYMCNLSDSTNINTITEFVPNCSMSAVIMDYRVDVCRITKGAHIERL